MFSCRELFDFVTDGAIALALHFQDFSDVFAILFLELDNGSSGKGLLLFNLLVTAIALGIELNGALEKGSE